MFILGRDKHRFRVPGHDNHPNRWKQVSFAHLSGSYQQQHQAEYQGVQIGYEKLE